MSVVLITGSNGLVGSEASHFFCERGFNVVGIDNDMRKVFFGEGGSTVWRINQLKQDFPDRYEHHSFDIRDAQAMRNIFSTYGRDIELIIHTAAQPSHDWARKDPFTDFEINANGTLVLLENTRLFSPDAVFIFCSTNKVYGDRPNKLPLIEQEYRWELPDTHPFSQGIDESMPVDSSMHTLFGVSKLAADLLVQEYGRYFGIKTACFRGGCLTGSKQSGVELHGFLSYMIKCAITGKPYTVYGYKAKQVRDNIHSIDLVNAFYCFYKSPKTAGVYNIGGGRFANCSMLEAIRYCKEITGKKLTWTYCETPRMGDHVWWISGMRKFTTDYPQWKQEYTLQRTLEEIYTQTVDRWT